MGTTTTTRSADRGATNRLVTALNRTRRRPLVVDFGVGLACLALAAWVSHGLWLDPATRVLALNPHDQILIEWFLAVDTRVLLGEHGLVSDRLNAPHGMNMVANATSLTLGFLLAPVTLTLGAPVSFAVLTTGNLAGTAVAWYLLFSRTLGARRAAAAVGGGFCGFAPAMVSQSNSHWHITAQWLVPVIVWSVVRLARAAAAANHRRTFTSGLCLGGLVVVQYFLGAEVLYLTAFALTLFTISYALLRGRWTVRILPRFLAGLAVAVGTATALLAYPLAVQFAGPGSVPDGPFSPHYYSADLASWPAFSPLSLAGTDAAAHLATGPAEYNTFLGWPLLLVAVAAMAWLADRIVVVAASLAAAAMAVLALGPQLIVDQTRTGLPLPYRALVEAPVVDGALPQRYALAVVPVLALLLVLALDRARASGSARTPDSGSARTPDSGSGNGTRRGGRVRVVVPVAVGLALLPLFPMPLPVADRDPVPQFISQGHWRDCVPAGGVLVPVPLPTPSYPEPMRWAAVTHAEFALPQGFFIGPYGPGGSASMGIFPRSTAQLLADVAETGQAPVITPEHRIEADRDLDHWRADCVALGPGQEHQEELLRTLEELLGPGERLAEAWIWRR